MKFNLGIIFIASLLLLNHRIYAYQFLKNANKRTNTENVSTKAFSRILEKFMQHYHTDPNEAFYVMKLNMEVRKAMNSIMKQRLRQMELENLWNLRRG